MSHRTSIDKVRNIIHNKGGTLLTETYINVNSELKIQCNNGHIWETKYDNIRKNSWCPYCSNKNKKSIIDANKLAKRYDGVCLSTKYINNKTKLKWLCKYGHVWEATFNDINHNRWCPECANGKYEKICRIYFETIFDKQFIKVRPSWLVNEKNNRLELDGYCPELGIAFEHNGIQHYEQSNWFKSSLEQIKTHDNIKYKLCEIKGIKLITIPSLFSILKIDKLKDFIKQSCIEKNIQLPDNYDNIEIDISSVYDLDFQSLKEMMRSYNIECLSDIYSGSFVKLKWRCCCGFIWNEALAYLKNKIVANMHICRQCHKNSIKKDRLLEMINIAKTFNGNCLSNEYVNSYSKLQFQCKNMHQWWAVPANVKRGSWCQLCHLNNILLNKVE